ncbi:hypothetical protein BHE90_014536 [Fusarium euwallaceae]|uniref:Uncharacterized protein n=1 Tax=Fusarium euwallaceae TaxID=1147111 RepID=A0A430L5Q1_9HYPO|nr:hypothetical protein BHE90_014536 [Fusarium euwallaceae]
MLPMPANENAFITEIIPAASVDDLLMHSILIVSGAHLNFDDDADGTAQKATLCHYSSLIRLLRAEFIELKDSDVRHDLTTHFGLGLELYSYLIVTNCLTPYGLLSERMFSMDHFITSLNSLSPYPTFGIMFAGFHGLFELIPQTSLLFAKRLVEQEAGVIDPSPGCVELHDTIQSRLHNWNDAQAATHKFHDKGSIEYVSKALRHSLEIYLRAAMQGSSIPSPETISEIQSHVDIILDSGHKLDDSQWTAILMWPCLIACSCTTQQDMQELLSRGLRSSRYRMKHSIRASNLLQRLWDDPDPRMYGPYGLYLAISKYDTTFATL